jgi:hypothetical protein
MTTRERLFLTPVEKLLKYRVFPWKLILNATLVILVTSNVLIMNSQNSGYFQSAGRQFYGLFYPGDYDFSERTDQLQTIGDAVNAVQRAVNNYYTINDLTFDVYDYTEVVDDSGTFLPSPPILTVIAYTGNNLFVSGEVPSIATSTTSYTLNQTYLGPIDPATVPYTDVQQFFHRLVLMKLAIPSLKNFAFGSIYRSCFEWAITVTYDFRDRGQLLLTMDQSIIGSCDRYSTLWQAYSQKLLWVNIIVIILSVADIALLFKASFRSFILMRRLRQWAKRQAELLAAPEDDVEGLASVHVRQPGAPSTSLDTRQTNVAEACSTLDREPLLAADHLATHLSNHLPPVAADQAPEKTSAKHPKLLFSFNNTLDNDGGGDIYVTADMPAEHGSGGRKKRIVFAPSVDSEAPMELDTGDGQQQQGDVFIGGGNAESAGNKGAPTEEANSVHKRNRVAAATAALALHSAWEGLTWRDRMRFINGWVFLALLADICNTASALLNLQTQFGAIPTADGHAFVMGFGLVFLWLGVLRYLEHNRTYFNIVLTLRRTAPRVLRFLIGVAPIFVSYALFSVVMFSDRIPRFINLTTASITLFANLNGDVIRETIMSVVAYYPIIGMLFYFTFIPLMIYVVLNIVLATVEESYFVTVAKTTEMRERIELEQHKAWHTALLTSTNTNGTAKLDSTVADSLADPGLLPLYESLPDSVDPLLVSARPDSNSVKLRPGSTFTTMLRLSEWEEIAAAGRGDANPLKLPRK